MTAALTPEQERFAHGRRVAYLATADPQAKPSVVPLCYVLLRGTFYSPLDEKPKSTDIRRLRRVRNILRNPDVALVIDRWDEDWSGLAYLLVRGRASLVEPDHPDHAPAVAALRERYPQYRAMALDRRPMIRITPERVHAWGAL